MSRRVLAGLMIAALFVTSCSYFKNSLLSSKDTDAEDHAEASDLAGETTDDTARNEAFDALFYGSMEAGYVSLAGSSPEEIQLIEEARSLHKRCIEVWDMQITWSPRLARAREENEEFLRSPPKTNDEYIAQFDVRSKIERWDGYLAKNQNDIAKLKSDIPAFLAANPSMRPFVFSDAPPEGWDPMFNFCFGTPPAQPNDPNIDASN